jgi:tripartite-type tricarboxylate transporter receptor subunit TctC
MNDPVVKERIYQGGAEARPSTPEEFAAFIKSETDKWAGIIKAAGVKSK